MELTKQTLDLLDYSEADSRSCLLVQQALRRALESHIREAQELPVALSAESVQLEPAVGALDPMAILRALKSRWVPEIVVREVAGLLAAGVVDVSCEEGLYPVLRHIYTLDLRERLARRGLRCSVTQSGQLCIDLEEAHLEPPPPQPRTMQRPPRFL